MNFPYICGIYGGCYIDGHDDSSKFLSMRIIRNEEEQAQAEKDAYEGAIQSCENWEGQYGFSSREEIAEDLGIEYNDIDEESSIIEENWRGYKEEQAEYFVKPMTLEIVEGMWDWTVEEFLALQEELKGEI